MRNPYTQLKHTEIYWQYCGLCFSSRKRHFLILKRHAIPHCPSAAHTTWELSSLVPQDLLRATGEASACMVGS